MTREEMYASIYTHDTVYHPPQEEGSAMLEVALGCSWGKCTFTSRRWRTASISWRPGPNKH